MIIETKEVNAIVDSFYVDQFKSHVDQALIQKRTLTKLLK